MLYSFGGDVSGERGGPRARLVQLGFIWGVWTLVGVFFASQLYVYFARTERVISMSWALAWQLTAVYVFALVTPLVLWLARRFRIERFGWRRSVLVHALAGTAISALWSASHVVIDTWFYGDFENITALRVARLTFLNIDKELLVYWILVLASHAADYYRRYREGELRASQAQLQALKMQLHPHFLFNSLHSISSLIHKDPDAADRMISRLGDFLRMTLDSAATQEVGLRKEIEFLNCYLAIERIRFNDRLTTEINVDPQALDCRVPNLILQPIVENAVRHGVAPRSAPCRVEVRAALDGDTLRLQVRDNGPGIQSSNAAAHQTQGGLGLANTRARLEHLYGPAYRFEMTNDPGGGLVVTLELPAVADPDDRAESLPQAGYRGDVTAHAIGR